MDEQALTIDRLAQTTGLTVRNVRNYQSRGLLPPPEVRGRTGYYGPEHVARLQLIREMQAQGFNLVSIGHLLKGANRSGEDVLGFARAILRPFETETPEVIEGAELLQRLGGDVDPRLLRRAEKLRLVVPLGEGRYEVPSPALLRAGEEVVRLGVPLDAALTVVEQVKRHAEGVTRTFVELFLERIWKPFHDAGQPEAEWPAVRDALERLRPLAAGTLDAVFAQTMSQAVEVAFGKELARGGRR